MDFARGFDELASSIWERQPGRLSDRYSLHAAETVIAIGPVRETTRAYTLTTTVDPVEPMPWAI
jgi:hypothetical protein